MQHDDPEPPAKQRGAVRPAVWLISAALFVGLTLAGNWAVAGLFGGELPRLDPRLLQPVSLALIGLFLAVYFLADGLRLHYVLRALDAPVRFAQVFPLVFVNLLFSNITPLATGGGFAQVWYLQRLGVPVGTSAAATTIRTILAMLVIFTAAPLFQILRPAEGAGLSSAVVRSVAILIAIYFAGFLILLLRPFWLVRSIEELLDLLCRINLLAASRRDRWGVAVRGETERFSAGFRQFIGGPAALSLGAILSTIVFLLTLFALPALLMALLDQEPDWLAVIRTLSIVTFLMYFAPTPGGAGFSELAFAGLMAGQIEASHIVLIIFVWRFLTIYLGMGIGVLVSLAALRPTRRPA